MKKGFGLLSVICLAAVIVISFGLMGCEADTAGPTDPLVNYLPQNFSLAIADGSASADGFAHNGVAVIKLDWNNENPGPNAVGPIYIYREQYYGYPHLDGGFSSLDDVVWDQANWTTLTLQNMHGNGGVTTVRIKSVYTYVNPPRIWFLLQWDDNPDLGNGNTGYWNNAYECQENGGGTGNWLYRYDWNEDWVAFMWDTWNRRYTDLNGDGEVADGEFVFESKTNGFQDNGCSITCHDDDANHPHHTNGPNQVCDVWMWTGTRTNFSANLLDWDSGVNDPAYLLDMKLDATGFGWGDSATIQDPGDDWLTYDDGLAGYGANLDDFGGHHYMDTTDPGANEPYLWLAEGAVTDFSPSASGWSKGDKVASYLHRTALGGCTDVLGRASYVVDGGTGTWTLEIERNIGAKYDEVENSEDVFLGIFEAHPDE